MSFYAYVEGKIIFEHKDEFLIIFEFLKEGGWILKEKKQWVFTDECNYTIGGDVDLKELSITFPCCTQVNIHRVLNKIEGYNYSGEILSYSMDGCFDGWRITREGEKEYALDVYGEKRGMPLPDSNHDSWLELATDIADAWLEDPDWEANSIEFIKE